MRPIQLDWMKNISDKVIDYQTLVSCRLCTGSFHDQNLNLGSSPLANELYSKKESALKADRFPLDLVMCQECKHIQLRDIVSPTRLFANYVYQSGISVSFQQHFKELANYISELSGANGLVLEIGSNDGLLLGKLKELGIDAVGIEPSKKLVDLTVSKGVNAYCGFWEERLSSEIIGIHGLPRVIVANNVFAHIEDMRSATMLISKVLDPNGYFVFEVSYFGDVYEKNLFDTVYHEHMSYHTISPLIKFFQEFNLTVVDVERISIHGGSIRVTVAKEKTSKVSDSVSSILLYEKALGLNNIEILSRLKDKIDAKRNDVKSILGSIEKTSFVFGYAAPAKLVTFLAVMGIEDVYLEGIVDDNPNKQNLFLPGSGHQILSSEKVLDSISLNQSGSFCCLVFAWNIGPELLLKLQQNFPQGTKVIQFVPTVSSVEL
jgi:SAM-dependent methyltransferase